MRSEIVGQLVTGLKARGFADSKLGVLEMKGQHLAGNPDTIYKQAVLQLMSAAFAVEQAPSVGELKLVVEDGTRIECDLALMTEWKTRLPTFMKAAKP